MKKITSLLLTAVLLCSLLTIFALPASAADGTAGNTKWKIEGTTLTISAVPGTDGKMCDFYNYNYAPWYKVDGKYSYETITELVIEPGVTRIGKYAFCFFSKIKKLEFPKSCAEIAYEAFYECAALEEVSLWGDVGEDAFVYCYALKKLVINDGCTSIGQEAFSRCDALEFLSLTPSVKKIDCEAFEYDTKLREIRFFGTKKEFENIDIVNDDNEPVFDAINGKNGRYVSFYSKTDKKYSYYDKDGKLATVDGAKETCWIFDKNMTELIDGWYIVDSKLDFGNRRIYVTGDANILLLDGCGIKTTGGISVSNKKTLSIFSASLDKDKMGYITSENRAQDGYAGIGSGPDADCNVNIHGGKITAKGTSETAGIGSGSGKDSDCSVVVTNGIIEATGGSDGAGIGSGGYSYCAVRLYGGTINAFGRERGAGIGSGVCGHCDVYIMGGTIIAKGAEDSPDSSAGIGSGCGEITTDDRFLYTEARCSVNIYGGDIFAEGGNTAPGIGSGTLGHCNLMIHGGNIKAVGGQDVSDYVNAFRGRVFLTNENLCSNKALPECIGIGIDDALAMTSTPPCIAIDDETREYIKHSFVNNVCVNCGIHSCEVAGRHTYADGVCTQCGNKSSATGSILSDGNWWIIIAVAVLALGSVAALIIVKKKKKVKNNS